MANAVKTVLNTLLSVELWIRRRYNEETKFSVTPSFVLTHSSDSIEHETRSNRESCLFVISSPNLIIKLFIL